MQKKNLTYLKMELNEDNKKNISNVLNVVINKFSLLSAKIKEEEYQYWCIEKKPKIEIEYYSIRNKHDLEILQKDIEEYFSSWKGINLHKPYIITFKEKTYLFWVFSHLIADGHSINLIEDECSKVLLDMDVVQLPIKKVDNLYIKESKIGTNKNSSINISAFNDFLGENYLEKYFSFPLKKTYEKNKIIFEFAKVISNYINEDIMFSILVNSRYLKGEKFNYVRDLHDEFAFIIKQNETKLSDFQSAIRDFRGGNISSFEYTSPLIQFNYEVDLYLDDNKKVPTDNNDCIFEEIINKIEKDLNSEKIIFANIIESSERIHFQIESNLKEKVLQEIIMKFCREIDDGQE
ncbi:hypothetical protein [Bacillus cereus]|uniref:hypothetical protein n=1 Tax=Bacillus cereus TaxID=1396 RepID=UPI000BF9AF40|nr:hypothetical protein [Bacillus cereus]PFD48729.1 hypothetical protein CN281_11265 [Bacillus cereus]PFH95730.1 hypothetical protein COI78_08585 [Bacillus cereus]